MNSAANTRLKTRRRPGEAILYNSLYGPKGDLYPAGQIIAMRQDMVDLGGSEAGASADEGALGTPSQKNTRFNEYRQKATSLGLADYFRGILSRLDMFLFAQCVGQNR